jgi:hypothetical protein
MASTVNETPSKEAVPIPEEKPTKPEDKPEPPKVEPPVEYTAPKKEELPTPSPIRRIAIKRKAVTFDDTADKKEKKQRTSEIHPWVTDEDTKAVIRELEIESKELVARIDRLEARMRRYAAPKLVVDKKKSAPVIAKEEKEEKK